MIISLSSGSDFAEKYHEEGSVTKDEGKDVVHRWNDDRRASRRFAMLLPVRLTRPGAKWVEACVLDISLQGALVAFEDTLVVQEQIVLGFDLGSIRELPAQVVWQGDGIFGCIFATELDQQSLEMFRDKGRSLPRALYPQEVGGQSVPELIAEAKRTRGVSATRLARILHVSRPTLWAWETGRSRPTEENLTRLTTFLGKPAAADRTAQEGPQPSLDYLDAILAEERARIAHKVGVSVSRIRISIEF